MTNHGKHTHFRSSCNVAYASFLGLCRKIVRTKARQKLTPRLAAQVNNLPKELTRILRRKDVLELRKLFPDGFELKSKSNSNHDSTTQTGVLLPRHKHVENKTRKRRHKHSISYVPKTPALKNLIAAKYLGRTDSVSISSEDPFTEGESFAGYFFNTWSEKEQQHTNQSSKSPNRRECHKQQTINDKSLEKENRVAPYKLMYRRLRPACINDTSVTDSQLSGVDNKCFRAKHGKHHLCFSRGASKFQAKTADSLDEGKPQSAAKDHLPGTTEGSAENLFAKDMQKMPVSMAELKPATSDKKSKPVSAAKKVNDYPPPKLHNKRPSVNNTSRTQMAKKTIGTAVSADDKSKAKINETRADKAQTKDEERIGHSEFTSNVDHNEPVNLAVNAKRRNSFQPSRSGNLDRKWPQNLSSSEMKKLGPLLGMSLASLSSGERRPSLPSEQKLKPLDDRPRARSMIPVWRVARFRRETDLLKKKWNAKTGQDKPEEYRSPSQPSNTLVVCTKDGLKKFDGVDNQDVKSAIKALHDRKKTPFGLDAEKKPKGFVCSISRPKMKQEVYVVKPDSSIESSTVASISTSSSTETPSSTLTSEFRAPMMLPKKSIVRTEPERSQSMQGLLVTLVVAILALIVLRFLIFLDVSFHMVGMTIILKFVIVGLAAYAVKVYLGPSS